MRGVGKPLLATALTVLLALALAACGDSGDPAAQSTTATEGTAPGDGGGAPEGSDSFRVPGGDNSIQDFGEEAGVAERAAASRVVVSFLEARARGDWVTVCAEMSAAALQPLERIAARSEQLRGKGCPELLATVTGRLPAASRASTLGAAIDSLRADGERGFALYHGTDGVDYVVPLAEEDGEWKVGSLEPTPL